MTTPRWAFMVTTSALLTPFLCFIEHQSYPVWTLETWLIIGAILFVTTLLALMSKPCPRFGLLGAAGILAYLLDYSFGPFLGSAMGSPRTRVTILAVLLLVLWLALLRLGKNSRTIVAAAMLALLFSSVAKLLVSAEVPAFDLVVPERVNVTTRAESQEPPPLLLLILDEHAGYLGLAEEPSRKHASTAMRRFYEKNGFHVFPHAFSRHNSTIPAVAGLFAKMGTENCGKLDKKTSTREDILKMPWRRIFSDELEKRGYRTRFYQSSYLPLCDTEAVSLTSCLTYASNNSLRIVATTPSFDTGTRAWLLAGHWLHASPASLYATAIIRKTIFRLGWDKAYDWPIVGKMGWKMTGPLTLGPVFDALRTDMGQDPRGVAFIAHLLHPHFPYIYDADCNVVPDPNDWRDIKRFSPDPKQWRAEAFSGYQNQVSCLYKTLDTLFEDLEGTGFPLDELQAVLLGDHGSRIAHWNSSPPSLSDMDDPAWPVWFRDQHMTLFAVKAKGMKPGETTGFKSTETLAWEFFHNQERLTMPAETEDMFFFLPGARSIVPDDWLKELTVDHEREESIDEEPPLVQPRS